MASTADAAAALKLEIARLTGAINQRKSGDPQARPKPPYSVPPRNFKNTYVNPSYKPPSSSSYVPPGQSSKLTATINGPTPPVRPAAGPSQPRDVTIGGVTFETSRRSLVRKDLPKPAATTKPISSGPRPQVQPQFIRNKGMHSKPRVYKPKGPSRHAVNRNMTLDNTRRPYQSRRTAAKKYVDKPCSRFTTTGACNRGLTCPYQHDPNKIAVCWPYLQGTCPHSADTCALSHDSTPNRTPLCVHFANNGRCTRLNCPFPHVHVGSRTGVCRDFAVLGYCERGLDCDKQHVRECPDFAEKGACPNKKCKLPHVIRANRRRQPAVPTPTPTDTLGESSMAEIVGAILTDDLPSATPPVSAEDAQLGDEFISLTFNESESDEEEDEEEEEDDDEENDNDEEEGESPILTG